MEVVEPVPDRIEPLDAPVDNSKKSISRENSKEQLPLGNDEKTLHSDTNAMNPSRDSPFGSVGTGRDVGLAYAPDIYAPQAQTFVYGGYESTRNEWEDYSNHFTHAEGVDPRSTGIYTENQSVMFHPGYGYNPQMPYGPYSPVTTPLPASGRDGQLYSPQHFPFTGPYYHQPSTPNISYLHAPTPISQPDLMMPLDQQDWLKSLDAAVSLTPLLSPAASPQPIGSVGSFGQGLMPLSSGMASQQQRSCYGFGSSVASYDQGYFHGGMHHHGNNFGGSIPRLGNNDHSLIAVDKFRRHGKGNTSICISCNDFLNEQNRGPRATRPKSVNNGQGQVTGSNSSNITPGVDRELYNRPDFAVEYKDAKFFIIKSYSEDNVHKSIKYGVWASTANGNKKLDAAYHEAKEKGDFCPVFLFFSVNASAQFCGVTEMIGPVDFDKSVDYWQQDKWSGQFPVMWHIIKDAPNSLFRHIILENNDNKPVTNSRDTQEVKFEQGLEMLSILKKYDSDMSILDDFGFYEERQKAMQDRKVRQMQQQGLFPPSPTKASDAGQTTDSGSAELIRQISKNFCQMVRIEKVHSKGAKSDTSSIVVVDSEGQKK
ncbi:hypothetical protein KSP40_PGU002542 [Platanthera guangdongensis]|uniref:YTH domain-containing family protein n=1 Tax=Platanthera guangdongensis TaxID=2320717 RepID=A0ABR2MH46_9ASPA